MRGVLWIGVSLLNTLVWGQKTCSVIHLTATQYDADCADRNLSSLPKLADLPVKYLGLRNNSFTSNVSFYGWKSVKFIDLSYNRQLVDISNKTFEGFSELDSLNVSYCGLKNVSSEHVKGKMLIKVLDLSGNVNFTQTSVFHQVVVKSLERGTSSLYLNDMNMTTINKTIFSSGSSLSRLHLRDNKLTQLPYFPKNLNYLDISNNTFDRLTSEPFQNSTRLTILLIENNPNLEAIDEGTFYFLENLAGLSLSGNSKLEHLPIGLFAHSDKLKVLSLAGCKFKTLSYYFKPIFFELNRLELTDNVWQCDPSIAWLRGLNSSVIDLSKVRCSNGMSFSLFYGLRKQSLVKKLMIVLVILTMTFVIIGSVYLYKREKKKNEILTYSPLGKMPSYPSSVYVSTVV